MNRNLFLILIFAVFLSSFSFPWGEKGHQIILKKALKMLPEEISFLKNYTGYLEERVLDPDRRRDYDKTEAPKHYIDLDYYPEFLKGEMIYNKDSLIAIYGEEKVTEIGLLPWATLESFNKLTDAFRIKDRDKILLHIADLAHYAADGHQPLHTVLNYDGQLSGQKGIHGNYETDMVDMNIQTLNESVLTGISTTVISPLDYIFNYIQDANFKNDILLASEKIASLYGETGTDKYYYILWFRTKNLTIEQFNEAATALASLIYTAWANAGKPPAGEIK